MTKKNENKSEDEHEEDVYEEDDVEELLDEDEVSEREAGFMEGYDREKNIHFQPHHKKKKK
jgi:hypothetical protein